MEKKCARVCVRARLCVGGNSDNCHILYCVYLMFLFHRTDCNKSKASVFRVLVRNQKSTWTPQAVWCGTLEENVSFHAYIPNY